MSNFDNQPSPSCAEFLDMMDAANPGIVDEFAIKALNILFDHQKMKGAAYWLRNNGAEAEADPYQRALYENELVNTAGKFDNDSRQIRQIVERYEDAAPVGRKRRV